MAAHQGINQCFKQKKKPDYSLHMGTKILVFGEISFGLMKKILNCLANRTFGMFEDKGGGGCKLKNNILNVKHRGGIIML